MSIKCFLIITGCFAFSAGFSQTDSTERKNLFIIKTDVLLPSIGIITKYHTYSLTFEYGFKTRHSFQITGLNSIYNNPILSETTKTYFIAEEYKYFLKNEKSYSGFFLGGFMNQNYSYYLREGAQNFAVEYEFFGIGGGPIFGYQKYFKKRISIDFIFGIGAGYVLKKNIIQQVGVSDILILSTYPDFRLAVNIGYRF